MPHFTDEKTDIIKGWMALSVPGQSPQTNTLGTLADVAKLFNPKVPVKKNTYNMYTMLEVYKKKKNLSCNNKF